MRVFSDWRQQPILAAGSGDVPVVVVQQQMVKSAQKNAIGDVGVPVVSSPVVDVVGFAPGGGSVASRPSASAVAGGQSNALTGGVETLLAAEVDALTVGVEYHVQNSGVADGAFDGFDRDGGGLTFDASVAALTSLGAVLTASCVARCGGRPAAALNCILSHEYAYTGTAGAENAARGGFLVGARSDSEYSHDAIEAELLKSARIGRGHLGARLVGEVDYAGAPRRGDVRES
jgi:hypothetical protein